MPGKIFISYRRGDGPGFAHALYARLEQAFSAKQLFMDVEGGIPPGADFAEVLEAQVAQCDVLLALIGQDWLTARDGTGARRLDNPEDFVRIEIESAMRMGKRVIPVLINRTEMPRAMELPGPLQPLSRRNALCLTQERFKGDVQGLIAALGGTLRNADSIPGAVRAKKKDRSRIQEPSGMPMRRGLLLGLGGAVGLATLAGTAIWMLQPPAPRLPKPQPPPRTEARLPSDPLIRTFTGHSGVVRSVAFSPDGHTALSGSFDETLKLWEVATGRELRTFTGHSHRVNSVVFSQDGRTALSGSEDNTVRIWDVATGRELRAFLEHSKSVTSVAFSPDGRTALSGSDDNAVRIWDLATGRELRAFSGHSKSVTSVAFSPDGHTALSGSFDETLKLWEVATGRELRTFTGHSHRVNSVAFSHDGRTALSGSDDNTMRIWDVATGRELRAFLGHSGWVFSVALSPNGRTALSGSGSLSQLKLWDVQTGKERHNFTWPGSLDPVVSVTFSPDGRMALSSGGTMLRLWDLTGL